MHLIGVHLMGVHLIGVHLIGVYLIGMYLIGVHLMGVHPYIEVLGVGRRRDQIYIYSYTIMRWFL
jgi:hypothetical protein